MKESAVPNDPSFRLQWPLDNEGQTINGSSGTPGADDDVVPAWDLTTGDPSVVVATTDSGLDYTHPDLAGNVWSNPGGVGGCPAGTHGYNVVAGSCDPMDDETHYGGHGTHVAGIIGAVGDNGIGVAGVNWTTTILPVKFLDAKGQGSSSQLISALEWIINAKQAGVNVRVVNDSATFVGTPFSQAVSDEIDRLAANNILFVTAAGNTSDNNDDPSLRRYPCGYDRPNEICVAATTQSDKLAGFSNYGVNTVDLAAPGRNVYSTLRGGTYGYVSGTSMATAEVSGAAALVLSSDDLPATALKDDILASAKPLPALAGLVQAGARLDVCAAIPACWTGDFGTTTIGSRYEPLPANRKQVNRYSLPAGGTVNKLRIYLNHSSTLGEEDLRGVIYSDQAGRPNRLLATSNELVFHHADPGGWYDLPLPAPVTLQPGRYWLGVLTGGTSGVARDRWYAVSNSRAINNNDYGAGPTDPFGTAVSDRDQMSLYAVSSAGP